MTAIFSSRSIIRKSLSAFAVAGALAAATMAGATGAEAKIIKIWPPHPHHHFWGPGLGLGLGLGLLGAAAYESYGCQWVAQYDPYGNYVGRVRVCE